MGVSETLQLGAVRSGFAEKRWISGPVCFSQRKRSAVPTNGPMTTCTSRASRAAALLVALGTLHCGSDGVAGPGFDGGNAARGGHGDDSSGGASSSAGGASGASNAAG